MNSSARLPRDASRIHRNVYGRLRVKKVYAVSLSLLGQHKQAPRVNKIFLRTSFKNDIVIDVGWKCLMHPVTRELCFVNKVQFTMPHQFLIP